MNKDRKQQICELLKGIETGGPSSVSVVNEEKYIQHNPQTHEGSQGLAELFKRLSKMSPRVNIVRVFEDNDFVFAHTEYDFVTRNISFEIFRFEEDQAVEHWDNIQQRKGPNSAGHSMVDGTIEVLDLDKTEVNRKHIQSFIDEALLTNNTKSLKPYFNEESYTEHNPQLSDNLAELMKHLSADKKGSADSVHYKTCHRVLAEGNFVLSVCEGFVNEIHSSFFDLYRLENEKIVEHWDTTEAIPSRDKWKNSNRKF